jgi:hypothetical protein
MEGAAGFAYINRGFFEDELLLMTNAVTNFSACSFLAAGRQAAASPPGDCGHRRRRPSLDEAIETLRRIRDRVILISAGTALRPLLRNGFCRTSIANSRLGRKSWR